MNQADWLRKRLRSARKAGCAPEIGALALLAVGAFGLFHGRLAHAQGNEMENQSVASTQKSLGDYFTDLGSDDAPERLFAARAVRSETLSALRIADRAPSDSIASMEARSVLVEIDARLPGACRAALRYENTALQCAELLAATEHRELLTEVVAARVLVKGKGPLKRFDAAVVKLGEPVAGAGSATLETAAEVGVATTPVPPPEAPPASPPAP